MGILLPLLVTLLTAWAGRPIDNSAPDPAPVFKQYCYQCHSGRAPMAGMNLEQLHAAGPAAKNFQQWEKVAAALEEKRMPPAGLPQPSDEQRRQAISWVRSELDGLARKLDGDPGRITVRRLTSGEYNYAIEDLTGVALDTGVDPSTDSVGGEGFTNFGDVQFMQDANLERYLEAAKLVSGHAVIGAGPLEFYSHPGKTGFELSAIARIREIYAANGFRAVSGEGGLPFGLDKYGQALLVAWQYRHRAALGAENSSIQELAAREGISARFAKHIWTAMNRTDLGYPSSEVAAQWRKLPAPKVNDKSDQTAATVRTACAGIQKFLVTWPSWLFSRGDVAAGGAGDESPLILNDSSLKVQVAHPFLFNAGGRPGRGRPAGGGPIKIHLNVAPVNPAPGSQPVVIWKNATVAFRRAMGRSTPEPTLVGDQPASVKGLPPPGPKLPLRAVLGDAAAALKFGQSPDGTPIGPDDFASGSTVTFSIPLPEGQASFELQVEAQLGRDHEQVFRIVFSDREDGTSRGIPTRALLGDPDTAAFRRFKAGVMELAALMPPNSHGEPTPADKDPIPQPFDSAFNVPEHDEFDTKVKYVRDDRFVYENILDDVSRQRLDHAWNDLYASFEYHDNYLGMIARHYGLDLKGKHIGELTAQQVAAMPAEPRRYAQGLRNEYRAVLAAQRAARPGHVEDCLAFAARAWRRPLSGREKLGLRAFYEKALLLERDHRKAVRAALSRILVAPEFLYRVESAAISATQPLSDWEMASRLSFFLWSSIPDAELQRAAAAGELRDPQQLRRQVSRMLADAKARRMATEFFGQWLGFYHFDRHNGVDTSRFAEFTPEVREAMYDEAVSFFEYVIRQDRPVREVFFADYTFVNPVLAKFYGIPSDAKAAAGKPSQTELVRGAEQFHRGGALRLGALLTAFSAPLRTSPVKRGDWVLRRVLGTALPPPPADAGSIPADDKLFGGLSLKEKLAAHKRNATCSSCHLRIDPLGFALEHYDSTGRWRDQYADGKPIDDTASLADRTEIAGIQGLLSYLQSQDLAVRRTLSRKLLGYALGRTVQASDQGLIDRMAAAGADAGFSRLVGEVAGSPQFRNRAGPVKSPERSQANTIKNHPRVGGQVGGQ